MGNIFHLIEKARNNRINSILTNRKKQKSIIPLTFPKFLSRQWVEDTIESKVFTIPKEIISLRDKSKNR